MDTFDKAAAERACARASGLLDRIEKTIFYWASKKAKLDKGWVRYMAERQDIVARMPSRWPGMTQAQCAFAAVFCSGAGNRKFRKAMETELDRDEIAFCKEAEGRPWRFSLFTIEERLGKDFYRIADQLGGEGGILKSPAVTSILRSNRKLFFTLLADNGVCLQTYGTVAHFNGIGAQDLAYFADAVDGEHRNISLADRIAEQPLPFLFLFAYADAPAVMHGKEAIRFCAAEREVPDPMRVVLPDEYLENGDDQVLSFRFGGEDFFDAQNLYLDLGQKKALLIAQTRKGYRTAAEFLKPYLKLPEVPELDLSPMIIVAAEELTGAARPYAEYTEHFIEEPDQDTQNELESINRALGALMDAYNNGRPVDIEKAARESGVSADALPELRRILEGIEKRFPIELPFGIAGYAPPPPAFRGRMTGSFEENGLFEPYPSPKARLLYQRGRADRSALLLDHGEAEDLDLEDFADALDGMYEDFWGLDDRLILNCTVQILGDQKDTYREAREYACEVLRLFHQVLLREPSAEDVRRFIRTYGRYLYLVLKPAGLIETDKPYELPDIRSGAFKLRSTEFFREWIRFT